MLIQFLCFWTLSIILFLFKTHSIPETGFCLRLQVEPTQLGPVDRASPYLRYLYQHKIHVNTETESSPRNIVLNKNRKTD
jgi:uncharacterized membrane protein YkgB